MSLEVGALKRISKCENMEPKFVSYAHLRYTIYLQIINTLAILSLSYP